MPVLELENHENTFHSDIALKNCNIQFLNYRSMVELQLNNFLVEVIAYKLHKKLPGYSLFKIKKSKLSKLI